MSSWGLGTDARLGDFSYWAYLPEPLPACPDLEASTWTSRGLTRRSPSRNGGYSTTPAAEKSSHVWTLEEIVGLLDGTLPD